MDDLVDELDEADPLLDPTEQKPETLGVDIDKLADAACKRALPLTWEAEAAADERGSGGECIYNAFEVCSSFRDGYKARAAEDEAELRTLRARVESYAMDLAALEGTNAANEGALRIQLERLHGERFRAESAEARVAALEKLFDDAGQGEHNVLALIDHYQSEAMAESEARRAALARVGELECAEADLEAQLAAAREEQAKWKPVLDLVLNLREFGSIRAGADQLYDCIDKITGLRKFHADGTWHTGDRCAECEILEVEAKGG